uniref:MIP06850p n=1 Tax=Drosophila melanogaster TaxID=7227 RepID=C0PUY8_DROME
MLRTNWCNCSYRFSSLHPFLDSSLACAIFFGHNCHYGLWSGCIQDLLQFIFAVVAGEAKPQPPSALGMWKDISQ